MQQHSKFVKIVIASLIAVLLPFGQTPSSAAVNAARTLLCSAGNYIVLGNVITNAAGVTISSRWPGALVGGNSPAELAGLSSSEVGTVANETSAAQHLAAIEDLRIAMIDAASLANSGAQLISGELSVDSSAGSAPGTFTPGVYKTASALNAVAGTTITLYGAGNYYFIAGAALTLGASVTMNFTGGALPQNVYWIAGSIAGDMGIGANSNVAGNFLARGTATFGTGAHLTGRVLVLNTVTFAANVAMDGFPADTSCTPQLFNVPSITGELSTPAQDSIKINFTVGTITYTEIGATALNHGKVSSYTPTSPQIAGTPISLVLYKYIDPGVDSTKLIVYTDITLIDGRAGAPYSDFVAAKTKIGASDSSQVVAFSVSGTIPAGLTFSLNSGYLTGTIATSTTARSYPLTITASSAGYADVSISLTLNVAAASTPSAELGITFTDITLVDGRAGDPYSDFVQAKGTSGGVYSTVTVNYVLTGTLPLGLTFNPLNGYLTGTISKDAIVGTYNIVVTAFAPGYPSQTLPFTFRVAAAPVITVIPSVIPAAPKTIVFTDTTLVNGHVGRSYADYVKAKAFIGSVSNNDKVTYSLTGILPDGLSFSKSTGYITGSVSKTATPGLYKVNVSAYASGYVTAQLPFEFTILASGTTAKPVTPTASPTPTPIATTAPKLNLLGTVWFDSGKSVLLPSSKMSLDLMVKALKGMNATKLSVSGYTDAVTGQSHSVLSLARANVVKKYLLSKNNALVITTKGLGIAITSKSSTASIQASRMAQVWVG